MIKQARKKFTKHLSIVNKYYRHHRTKTIPIIVLVLLLPFLLTVQASPFSFELLVKEHNNFTPAEKIENEYYMLFEKQQFGFKIQAKKNGFISLWYQQEEKNTIHPISITDNRIYPIKEGKTYKIITFETSKKPFLAVNVDKTDHYYAVFTSQKKQQVLLLKKSKLIKQALDKHQVLKIEIDVSANRPVLEKVAKNCQSDEYIKKIIARIKNKKIIRPKGNSYLLSLAANTEGLRNTHLDACRFKEVMQSLFSIPETNIRLYQKVTRNDFIAGMKWLKQSIQSSDDLVIFYFSGHGATYKQTGGVIEKDGYDEVLIMQDQIYQDAKKLADEEIMIRDNYLYKELSNLPTEQVLSVVDACHSAGTARAPKGSITKFYNKGNFRQKTRIKTSTGCKSLSGKGVLFAASEEDKLTVELPNGGEFTLALLDKIANTKNNLSLDRLFLDVFASGNPCIVGDRRVIENLKIINK